MNTATKIRNLTDWRGDVALYRTEPPLDGNEYVVVSAVDTSLRFAQPGTPPSMQIETYIFAADADGIVAEYGELSGSMRGTLDHAEALGNAGYEIIP